MIEKAENTYIINLDAAYVYKAMVIDENKEYKTDGIDKTKLFTATMPYSLEIKRLDEHYPKEIYIKNKKQYTKAMINISFDSNYNEWVDHEDPETGEITRKKISTVNKKKMRKYLYNSGFKVDNTQYVFYKRGASKARTGNDLFIKKNMYNKLINRSRLTHNKDKKGLYFEEGEILDLTSLHAYQSLILSGLEDIIEIDKESILIVSDIYSLPFKTVSSVTIEEGGVLKTETKEVERINNMTDGEGLIDESLFELSGRKDKGMMLLRSDLFKCCGLNTKIQEFFNDNKEFLVDGKVKDLYRGYIDASKIKLITTPSSVKYLKFTYKFDDETDCYNHWFKNIDNVFGIVKSDKMGNYGTWNRMTYQIINSMPFAKENIADLVKIELDYINKLKTDLAYFKNHVAIKNEETVFLENDIVELSKIDEDSDVEFKSQNESYKSAEFVNNLLSINSDFQYTSLFKQWRIDQINDYKNELRKGKIRIKNTIYCTIFANPYELLLHSVGIYEGKCIATGTEGYCKFYKEGQELATFRNPHINSGNVMLTTNKYHKEYKYFNLTNNILIINVSDNDSPDRGQGYDYDSDALLLTSDITMVNVSKDCAKYPTPLNLVKGDKKERHNTMDDLAELDNVLSNNFIGKIINKSQIINSYMWDCKKKNMEKGLVDKLYDISSMLSSLSQIELDKAKKSFDNISMPKELKKVNDMVYKGKGVVEFEIEEKYDEKTQKTKYVKRMIVPNFFGYVAEDNTYRILRKFETPMDYLQELIDENRIRNNRGKKDMCDLLVNAKSLSGARNSTEQHVNILNIITKCGKKINSCRMPSCILNEKGKNTIIRKSKNEAIEELKKLKINQKTIYSIFQKCFGKNKKKDEWVKYGMLILNLLYHSHQLNTLSVFKNKNNINESLLISNRKGNIDIFGYRYTLIGKKYVK